MMRDSKLCFRNSDAKSPEYEECEHDGPKVTSTHVGDTTKDDLEIYGGDDLKTSSKITSQRNNFKRSSKNKVKPP